MTGETCALLRQVSGAYVGNTNDAADLAGEVLARGESDLGCVGRRFISNPDLVDRIRLGAPFAAYDEKTFYGGDETGYTDYPALTEEEKARYANAA